MSLFDTILTKLSGLFNPPNPPKVQVPREDGRKSAEFRAMAAERMRKLHADPEFAKARDERAAERMRKLHADPEFAKAHAERMRKLNADPEFAKANAERMRKRHQDPEFAKANAERAAEQMRKLHQDPEFEKHRIKAIKKAARARRKLERSKT